MTERERWARLAHDVGKYVGRIARNVPEGGPFPETLAPLLAKDLYELPGGRRASELFEELTADTELPEVRARLVEIDALEGAVRAAEPRACLRAAALAREVEDALRARARDAE